MSQDQEWLVRLQFLEEAQEYLSTMESELLGLSSKGVTQEGYNSILRAAHSIKGGSALMGFAELSQVAHRLEDFFKVLRAGHRAEVVDVALEHLFLQTLDCMVQMLALYRQKHLFSADWMMENPQFFLDQLYDRLGDPQPEDDIAALSADAGEDMVSLMFSSEVGPCLERLEGVLGDPALPLVKEEFIIACQEMAGLGEMLDLPVFSGLCQQVVTAIDKAQEGEIVAIATAALSGLQRVRALVILGELDLLPTQFVLPETGANSSKTSPELTSEITLEVAPEIAPEVSSLETSFEISSSLPPETIALASDAPAPTSESLDNLEVIPVELVPFELAPFELDPFGLEPFELSPSDLEQIEKLVVHPDPVAEAEDLDAVLQLLGTAPIVEPEAVSPERYEAAAQAAAISSTELKNIQAPAVAPRPAAPAKDEAEDSTVRISIRQLERLGELFGELNTERGGLSLRLRSLKNLVTLMGNRVKALNQANEQLRLSYDRSATASRSASSPTASSSLPILAAETPGPQFDLLEMDQYSDLHLVAQEIIERVVQIQEVSSDIELALDETEGISRQLGRTAQQMQIGMTQVRMRPLAELTRRFPRQLRQLSLEHGKSVSLKEKGTGTLIERSILEALQDPLMHLLRNCFDHGIESPEVRQSLGKPAEGSITITASYRGNQTVITVSDDGGGINLEKIKTKVVSGLGLTTEEISTFSEQEILDLIFEPGFSTAEAVTDLSGRGVGMDVVRKNIEAIQGTVQVETELGVGTTFTLVVPLSLSVTRALVVECQGLFVALPASIVEEMTLLSPSQILTAADRELIEWQGYTVPLLRLEHWIRFNRPPIKLETESVPIIDQEGALIVTQGNAPYAIYCDRYWGEQEVTTRLVEGNISLPPGFSGCVVLGDGRIVPLVDTEALLSWILSQPVPPFGPAAQPVTSPPQRLLAETPNLKNPTWDSLAAASTTGHPAPVFAERPTVMIIDDSINVRRFLAITLEKAGYRVEQAKDGLDALEKLREDNNIDAIVSDVEMPRMDGFRFLATIQTVETCKTIPVVMLTSRSGTKHRQLAQQLGAADYFSKPFKQNELLGRLAELTQASS